MNAATMTTQEVKREGWIDQYRGILFLFVIIYHTFLSPVWLRHFFDFFFLPGFFFLSGYLFRPKGIRSNMLAIVNTLLIPFVLFSVIISIYTALSTQNVRALFDVFYDYFILGGDGIWFIPCLIVVEVVSVFILNYFNRKQWVVIFTLLFFLCSYLATGANKHHLPWNIDTASYSICFFLVGYLVKNIIKPNLILSCAIIIFYIITSQYLGQSLYNRVNVDLHNNVVGNPFVYIILGIIASYALFSICRYLPVCWYLRKLGQYTLFAFPFHPFVYRTVSKVVPAEGAIWGG